MPASTETEYNFWTALRELLKLIFCEYVPYFYTKTLIDDAVVVRLITPREALTCGLSPRHHWAEVKVEWYRDCQTVYGSDYHERRGYIRLSPQLFKKSYRGKSFTIAYQRNRNSESRRIRARIAT